MTLEQIDRAIFEKMRVWLVENEHLPNILAFQSAELYQAARLATLNRIDIFGVGSNIEKGSFSYNEKAARVIIRRQKETTGRDESNTYTIDYEIRYLCATIELERACGRMIYELFKDRVFVETESGESFFMTFEEKNDISDLVFLQKSCIFKVRGVTLHTNNSEANNVLLNTIDFIIATEKVT